ncbi:AAA family ATPase [Candidatus Magnetobacterium casense]|uniref:AAA family ATPase n=1 Tax=Candidatus Magnetobacterium casense TaxID=1455061 RepID=UPI0006985CF2|nr:ATP-binding protein [Candidatus Magnetobacterium casensis]
MFKKITIDNFRAITHIEIDDLRRINLFVGKNNSGKSSILEAICLLSHPTSPGLMLLISENREVHNKISDNLLYFLHNLNVNTNIEITGEILSLSEIRKLLIIPKTSIDFFEQNADYQELLYTVVGFVLDYRIEKEQKSYKTESYIYKKDQGTIVKHATTIPDSIEKGRFFMRFLPHNNKLSSMVIAFDSIQVKKLTGKLIKILKLIEPSIEGLVNVGNVIYCDAGLDKLIPLSLMGDGVLRIFSIVATIVDAHFEKGGIGIALIDEIEKGFYYSALLDLWDAIYEFAKEFDVQVFATTHSMECIQALADSYSSKNTEDDEIRMYRIERNNGMFDIIDYSNDLIMTSLDSNWEMR